MVTDRKNRPSSEVEEKKRSWLRWFIPLAVFLPIAGIFMINQIIGGDDPVIAGTPPTVATTLPPVETTPPTVAPPVVVPPPVETAPPVTTPPVTDPPVTSPPETTPPTTAPPATTTPPTTIPEPEPVEPPPSGFNIVDPDFYPDGVGIPEDGVALGIIFDLPVGAEIRAPFGGKVTGGRETSAGAIITLEYGEDTNFAVMGNGLEFVDGDVEAGDVMAVVVSEETLRQAGYEQFNVGLWFEAAEGGGTYVPDPTILPDYFPYVAEE